MFSQKDLAQIKRHGLSPDAIDVQIGFFKSGFPPARLNRAATVGDGILSVGGEQIDHFVSLYDREIKHKEVVKFVPASGAASRMFKSLFAFADTYSGSDEDYQKFISETGKGTVFEFFKHLERFAFYEDLQKAFKKEGEDSLIEAHVKKAYGKILKCLLEKEGLNYGKLPKGLLAFHKEGGAGRTPVEEHLVEGCRYAKNHRNTVNIHFTVSPEHLELFEKHVSAVRSGYEEAHSCELRVSYSLQKPGTDTIAVSPENNPFRNPDHSLLFRPAGHGALLENLNDVHADIIFLKNIDNVVPDSLKADTIRYKKVIGGVLLEIQSKIFDYSAKIEGMDSLDEVKDFITHALGYDAAHLSTKSEVSAVLHRPIRVCGMVKNEGEPGGGPFWVADSQGRVSLQIVESAQVDTGNEGQKNILRQSTHFNPVDVVCAVRDREGEKYDLMKYRDPGTGFITRKSKDGRELKAQELPGLWNGSMAYWNTVFVEVPVSTFNPVKTVNDLLKPQHQGS